MKGIILFLCVLPVFAASGEHGSFPSDQELRKSWVSLTEQVWARQVEGTTLHYARGVQGMEWALGKYQEKLAEAESAYLRTGDASWLERMEHMAGRIDALEINLADHKAAAPSGPCAWEEKDVDAQASVSPTGPTANAMAVWQGDCIAEVYATCTAQANGLTTTQTNSDEGTNVMVVCSASEAGTSSCSSYAYAEVFSPSTLQLHISDTASNCPSNLSVSIQGPSYIVVPHMGCANEPFTSVVSGGTGPYSYQWKKNGVAVDQGSSYTDQTCWIDGGEDFSLELTVTDANGVSVSKTVYVEILNMPGK